MAELLKATRPSTRGHHQRRAHRAVAPNVGPRGQAIASLQRNVGNRSMHRLLGSAVIQTKLTVGPADDEYEREADRVADEVMRMPPAPEDVHRAPRLIQRKCRECEAADSEAAASGRISRKCASCAQEEEQSEDERRVQAQRAGVAPAEITSDVGGYLRTSSGRGRPLDPDTRSDFEARFGHDFKHVRIHDDAAATASARAINARAYTFGHNIVFGAGEFAPATSGGCRLLAHELTHVVQQRGTAGAALSPATIQRQPTSAREKEIALSESSPGQVDVSLTPPKVSIYNFAIGKAALKDTHRDALQAIGAVIKRHAGAKLRISAHGHTDSSGDELQINLPLSRDRAMAARRVLQGAAGMAVDPNWYGESRPMATNDAVAGRSRNRRVDIDLWLIDRKKDDDKKDEEKKRKKDDGNGGGGGDGDGDGDGDGWDLPSPCQSLLGALFCGLIACALAPEVCLFCVENPRICLGPPKPPKKRDKGKGERPCVVHERLPPAGVITARNFMGPYGHTMMAFFDMEVIFKNDSTGCTCSRGEYKQEILGFAQRNYGKRDMQRADPDGITLDPWMYQEDVRGGRWHYGIRAEAIGNQDYDQFTLPDRATGCRYYGQDYPSMINGKPGEHMHFEFHFRGAPVDRLDRSTPLTRWHYWTVVGEYFVPGTA